MLFHQLRQDFVLGAQLSFQGGDPLLARLNLFVRPGCRAEGSGPALKELLKPPVKGSGVELMFVAQSGNRNPIDQVPAENGDLLLRGVMLALVAHESSPL